jgi:hypothetical protein
MSVKHKFTCGASDPSDSTLIKPSNWNDTHTVTLLTSSLSANTTLDNTYEVVLGTAGVSGITITLPSAVLNSNVFYYIKKVDSAAGSLTIATTSSQTIDGQSTYTLINQFQYVKVVSDGANWQIIGNN